MQAIKALEAIGNWWCRACGRQHGTFPAAAVVPHCDCGALDWTTAGCCGDPADCNEVCP